MQGVEPALRVAGGDYAGITHHENATDVAD
jgi:hypothetical protein